LLDITAIPPAALHGCFKVPFWAAFQNHQQKPVLAGLQLAKSFSPDKI